MSNLSILNHEIRQTEGLYCLNDLHKASGGNNRHRPSLFIRTDQTKSLIAEIEAANPESTNLCFQKTAIKSVKGGKLAGTYACKQLVLAYGMWVSPQLHLAVINAFLEQQTAAKPSRTPTRLEALQMALEAEQENQRLQAEVIELKPAADALARLSAAEGSLCITNAAKALSVKPKQLFNWLSRNRWIYRRPGTHWIAYAARIEQGVLEHKVSTIITSDGEERITEQVRVTPKGMAVLSKRISGST